MSSPYTPPASMAEPSPGTPAVLVKPAAIGALGLLDLIFAGIGTLCTLASLAGFTALRFHPEINYDPATNAGTIRTVPAWHEIFTTIVTAVITVLVLIAGLKLVKCRRDAIRFSNRYALASICGKLINIPLVMNFSRISIAMETGGPDRSTVLTVMILSGIAIGSIYPILCLILLNRPRVREWLSANGT